jgi:hypothetical protein
MVPRNGHNAGVLRFLRPRDPRPGGLYSVAVDERGFAVAKVLVVERGAIHVRVYSNRYADRPSGIDPTRLFLAPVPDFTDAALNATRPEQRPDPGAFGIGHLPLRPASWAGWRPRLIAMDAVAEEELEGYRVWRDQRGGLF